MRHKLRKDDHRNSESSFHSASIYSLPLRQLVPEKIRGASLNAVIFFAVKPFMVGEFPARKDARTSEKLIILLTIKISRSYIHPSFYPSTI